MKSENVGLDAGPAPVGSALLYIGGSLDDIVRAPLEVRKHNRRIELLGLAPMVTNQSAGLALSGRF